MTEPMNTTPPVGLKEQYALGLLAEEFGESLQLIGKALRFGLDTPGVKDPLTGFVDMEKTPRLLMVKELGDVMAAIDYAALMGIADRGAIAQRATEKLNRLTDPDAKDNLGRRLAPGPVPAPAPEVAGLVERLRSYRRPDGLNWLTLGGRCIGDALQEAADTLSALSARLAEVEGERDALQANVEQTRP